MKKACLEKIEASFKVFGKLKPWNSVQFDSRLIGINDWFVALEGEKSDGHDYIEQALAKGASVVVVNELWWQNSKEKPDATYIVTSHTLTAMQQIAGIYRDLFGGKVIAITGSAGKTTTRNWVANVLQQQYIVSSSHKNYNNHLGLPYSILNSNNSSDFWVLELGSNHPGEIEFLAKILRPDWSIVTNIGTAHLGFFANQEEIFNEKVALFKYTKEQGLIILNKDDKYLKKFNDFLRIKTISLGSSADYVFDAVQSDKVGRWTVKSIDGSAIKLPIPGEHQIYNALFAYAVGREAGMEESKVVEGLESLTVPEKRMEIIKEEPYLVINDAYNANKESVIAAGKFLADCEARRKIFVWGDVFELGGFSGELHKEMAEVLDATGLDIIVTIGKATEEASKVIKRAEHYHFDTHTEIREFLKENLQEGDALLLKASRGMQLERILENWDL